jgi:diguanylate cyclase (GGDEF)-like protein
MPGDPFAPQDALLQRVRKYFLKWKWTHNMQEVQECPLPKNESQRLASLYSYEILDTEPEPEFDALTRVASQTFSMPVALVAMMDSNRLWFKSKLGISVPQLDRKIAFCAHAIMSPTEPLVVNDLTQDSRFAHNLLVVNAPHLRFYAGAPLLDASGHALGTVAVLDAQPREFTDAQRACLNDFATLAMTALQSRKRANTLRRFALTDYLTGVPNRAQFDLINAAEMGHAVRSDAPYSIFCMDLDGFKQINDRYGHAAGDQVLCEIAKRLVQTLRQGDLLARLGGDEFAVVARSCNHEAAAALSRRFADSCLEPILLRDGQQVKVGISIGTATSSASATDAAKLLNEADKALYAMKHRTV